jgi:hypothetical protein
MSFGAHSDLDVDATESVMSKVLLEMSMSLDGYVTGPDVTPQEPMAGRRAAARDQAPEPLRGLRPRKVDAVSATVLDTSMSPRSKRPPTEEAR